MCLNWSSCLFPSLFLTEIFYLFKLWWVLTEVTVPLTSFSEGFSLVSSNVFQEYNHTDSVRYFVHVMKMCPFDLCYNLFLVLQIAFWSGKKFNLPHSISANVKTTCELTLYVDDGIFIFARNVKLNMVCSNTCIQYLFLWKLSVW